MGQKSNITTVRVKLKKNLSFLNQTKNSKVFQYGFNYLNLLEIFLNKKNIFVISKELNLVGNLIHLNFTIFYFNVKLAGYKKRTQKVHSGLKYSKNQASGFQKTVRLFTSKFTFLRGNLVLINLKVLNAEVNKFFLKEFYKKTAKFVNVLFSRKFNLFIDFLKISSLFYQKKISGLVFLYILGQVFKVLPKRKHNRFLFFLKQIFQVFIGAPSNKFLLSSQKILGIKFIVNGKLQGKTRSNSCCIQVGVVPNQSIDKHIEFSKLHVYTLYGVFGFKMWIHRN
jgi:hypothetical protein